MIEKLKAIKEKFDQLTADIANPEVIADMKTWQAKVKEHSNLTELMEEYDNYVKMKTDFDDAIVLSNDGHVAEGSAMNFFLVKGDTLITSKETSNIFH